MKKVCVYKCKQCDTILDSYGFLILPENILDEFFESEEKGYDLHHEGWGKCILCTDGDNQSMGGALFDTAEDAIEA